MEGIAEEIQQKLEEFFKDASDVGMEAVLAGWGRKTPLHFSQIEAAAGRVAALWSCRLQEWAAREMTAQAPDKAACPTCGEACPLELQARVIQSICGTRADRGRERNLHSLSARFFSLSARRWDWTAGS